MRSGDQQPDRRRTNPWRRITVPAVALLVVAGAGVYLPTALLAPVPAAAVAPLPVASAESADAALVWPGYGASAIGAVGHPGVLDAAGSTEPLPIASITKVITVLAALEARPLEPGEPGPTITFDAADAALYGAYRAMNGKVAAMPVGSSLSQLDTMKVVLVVSANNYADAFAEWAFGSRAAFLTAVDAWLTAHGLTSTTVVEPTGIDPANVSTSSDLVELGKLALADPLISSIVALPSVSYPGVGSYDNTNHLLGIDGVDGIKTGTLDQAGANLLFAADYLVGDSTVTVVGVVLGSPDHDSLFPAVRALLDSAEAGFSEVVFATAGRPFAEYTAPWGGTALAVAAIDASAVLWSTTEVGTAVSTLPVQLAAKGTEVGTVVFTAGQQRITVPLVLDREIEDPGPWWRLGRPLESLGLAG